MVKFISSAELDLVNESSILTPSNYFDQQVLRQTENLTEVRISDIFVILRGDFTKGLNSTASFLKIYKNASQYIEVSEFNINLVDFLQTFEASGEAVLEESFFSNSDKFFGSDFNDNIHGFGGDDSISGKNGNDNLAGGQGNDVIYGEAGGDTISGDAGNDLLDGGAGKDTAVYSGSQSNYTLTLSPTSTTITDRRSDGNGTDTLIDMEFLDFDSGTFDPFNLDIFGGPSGLDPVELESFVELYIAYFNRAPDAIGLNFWGTQFANGTTLEEMATLFVDQDETRATYPDGTTNEVFATSVYDNVLGRTPDQSGIDFWVGKLDQGDVSRDQFILNVLQGAKSDLKPELGQDFVDQQLADRTYLENKVDIGAYFAVHKGMSEGWQAEDVMEIFGDQDTSNINGAVAAIDNFYTDALDPTDGEFLMPLVGVLDDPFAVA